jgi:hypothetical protein
MCYQSVSLIELIAYYFQEVMSVVLEANLQGTKKLSVLRVEQCEDGGSTEKFDYEYVL